MVLSGRSPWDEDAGDAADVVGEALDVVSDALRWELTEARWRVVEPVLITMESALAHGDLATLAEARADLELVGPLRFKPIDGAVGVDSQPRIQDRLNRLVHQLGEVSLVQLDRPGEADADGPADD